MYKQAGRFFDLNLLSFQKLGGSDTRAFFKFSLYKINIDTEKSNVPHY